MAFSVRSNVFVAAAVSSLACACNSSSNGDSCAPGDQNGVNDMAETVLVTVSDTAFAVGGVDSGSMERNITSENSSPITLTLTNVGMKPHDLVIGCIPTGLPAGCPSTSCFPKSANFAPLAPGASMTTSFTTPAVEGAYTFTSDVAGDDALIGEFVLM
jgi:hypothetical protein